MSQPITASIAACDSYATRPAPRGVAVSLWRVLADRWQRQLDHRMIATVSDLDHPGVLADLEVARRYG